MQLLTEINKIFLLQETQFVVDEVSNVIKEAIETTIGGNSYTVKTKTNIHVGIINELLTARQGEPVDQRGGGVLLGEVNTGLSLVNTSHVTCIQASDWSIHVM